MRIHNLLRLLSLTGIGMLISLPHNASAQWPTFDISAIKEGITTNIELVKQSKVVSDAMATAGKINAGIGDAKASASKFAGDNLAKAQEKMKKLQEEKERIEEKKKKYDDMKADLEEKKKQMEEAKAQVAAAKAMAQDVKSEMNDVKEMAGSVSDLAKSKINDAKSSAGLDETTPVAETPTAETPVVASTRTAFGAVENANPYEVTPPNSDDKAYGEDVELPENIGEVAPVQDVEALTAEQQSLKEEEEALERQKAELEVDAMLAKTPEEKAEIAAKQKALGDKYTDLNNRKEKNSADLAAAQETKNPDEAKPEDEAKENEDTNKEDKEPQPFHRAKILDGETSSQAAIPESHRAKILDEYKAPTAHRPKILDEVKNKGNASGGFRKRALPARTSALDSHKQYASRSFSETLVFAAVGTTEMPDGTVNGVFILSDRLAQECDVNVKDLEDEKVMDDCIKKLVVMKSDKEQAIAQEAMAIYKTIMQETVNGLIAESMATKNLAANYETKVLEKLEKEIANTKNTRDDTGGLSLTNKELQYLLNRILTIYSAQLSLDALTKVGGFDSSYYEGSTSDSSGEKK